MKKIINLSFIFLSVIFVTVSCNNETEPYDPDGYVQFSTESLALTENATSPLISKVLLGRGSNPDGVTVNFTVNSSDASRYTIEPANGSLLIPAGEFTANIIITPIDNAESDGNASIELELVPGEFPVGIAGEGRIANKQTILVTDDDCELDYSSFVGVYEANEFGYCDGCYEVSISYDEANQALVLSNLYETGGTTYISLDNSDPVNPSVDFRSKEFDAGLQVDANFGNVYATNPTAGNKSSFRTCDQFLDLIFRRCIPDGRCFAGEVQIQLTKK